MLWARGSAAKGDSSMRTKLADRALPDYTQGEETLNTVSHIAGGVFALAALVLCVWKSAGQGDGMAVAASCAYGLSMLILYCMSSIYHGLPASMGKKVLQVLDHCTIYFMIAGTYTPIALCALRPLFPVLGWSLFGVEWGLTLLAATLTAIDLKQYGAFSMTCYILMGWGIAAFLPQAVAALSLRGVYLLFAGGICYTLGAVLYGIGAKKRWFHGVFHIFVLLGSVLHFFVIYFFAI